MIDSKFLALMAATGISLVSTEAQAQDRYEEEDTAISTQRGQAPTIFTQVNENNDFGPNNCCSNNGCSSY